MRTLAARAFSLVRGWLPPPMTRLLQARFGSVRFAGDFPSWSAAIQQCSGYSDSGILLRVEAAALAVKEGRASFERDAVIFPRIEHQCAVLAGLLLAASNGRGILRVLDFGGGLGTSYQQNRAFLVGLGRLQWCIVEQRQFVESGRRQFEDGTLQFFEDLDACLQSATPDVVLMSSVLPYVEDPYGTLRRIIGAGAEVLIVDRTPFIEGPRDRLCVQIVAERLYAASYPAWFFSHDKFMRLLTECYCLVQEFEDSTDRASVPSRYLGYVFRRKQDR